MDRRDFLKGSAAITLGAMAPGSFVLGKESVRRVGLIGTGWYGKSALLRLIQVEPVEVVALCDVDSRMLAEAAEIVAGRQKSGKQPRIYGDYRKMLKQEEMDIVQVSTPDHWHCLAMTEAVKSGADVWVEKPIGVDVAECQAMVAAVKKYKKVAQVNMQRRSTPHLIDCKKRIIDEGRLGKIGHVEVYCYYHMRARNNPPDTAAPANLDYEMWTGPAPMRPYNSIVHPRGWRAFMEYGNGIVGDMCVHMYDMVRWLLGLGWPKRVSSTGGIYLGKESKANISDTQTATFEHDDMSVVWEHRTWGDAPDPKYSWGATIYGEKGTLKASVMTWDFVPSGGGEALHGDAVYEYDKYPEDKTEKDLERHVAAPMRGHWRNFLSCVDSRSKPVSNIEEGYISAASCILANMSMKLNRTLAWGAEGGNIIGDSEANGLLARPYRKPWVHPTAENV